MARPDFRPRFLPDSQLREEWGAEGVLLYEVIRKGFRVPPTAAWGASQVRSWLESLPSFRKTIETWRLWGNPYSLEWVSVPDAVTHLANLRDEITTAPMPFGFSAQISSLKQRVCGGKSWPIQLRLGPSDCSATISDAGKAYEIWREFRDIVSLQFTLERAVETLARMEDPRDLVFPIRIQPVIQKLDGPVPEDRRKGLSRLAPEMQVDWVWDGEEIWITQARIAEQEPVGPRRDPRKAIRFSSGTGSPASRMTMSWIEGFLREARPELKLRYGIDAPELERAARSSADGFWVDPEALRFERASSGGERLRWILSLFRRSGRRQASQPMSLLEKRLPEWEALTSVMKREADRQLDREEASVRQWSAPLVNLRDGRAIGRETERLISMIRGTGVRALGVSMIREALYEALCPLIDRSSLPAAGARSRLNSDWTELKAAVDADPRGLEWVSSGGKGVLMAPAAREKWSRFLQRHGHFALGCEVAMPALGEQPSRIFSRWDSETLVSAAPRAPSGGSAPSLSDGSHPVFARAVGMAHELTLLLDRHWVVLDLIRSGVRRIVLAGGDALVRKQFVRSRADILFLELHEMLSSLDDQAMTPRFLVEERRKDAYARELLADDAHLPVGLTRGSTARLRAALASQES